MLNSKSIIEKTSSNHNHWILCAILLVGASLRFYNLSNLPFSHDELSALLRTDFNSFHELIELGVKTDYHPAGIQVFLYYWVQLFGYSEWIVKLPFVLTSITSIYLVYQIGSKWKNETVGLICAAFLATTQYSVMYGTTARPYATGLFFILVLVNVFLSLRMHSESTVPFKKWIIFILAGTAAAYNHHYSLFVAGLIGITGLFFIPRKLLFQYVIAGIIIALLYLPHLSILLHQLSKGGVGGADGWLGIPTPAFFSDYFGYLFHFSVWPLIVCFGIMIYGLFHASYSKNSLAIQFLALILFLFPLLFGYFYSRLENPILQFSILIFSHFFLYLFLFGHIKSLSVLKNGMIVGALLIVNSSTLIINRQHFSINFNSIYEHVTLDLMDARKQNSSIPGMIDCSPSILAFYDKQKITPTEYVKYRNFESTTSRLAYIDSVSSESDYFYFGGTSYVDPTFIALIQTKFPHIVWQHNYFTGTTYLFSKKKKSNNDFIVNYSEGNWSDGKSKLPQTKEGYYILDSLEFGPVFNRKLRDLIQSPNDNIDIKVRLQQLDFNSDLKIVALLELSDTIIQYGASSSNEQEINSSCHQLVHTFHLNNVKDFENFNDADVKIYLWNSEKKRIEFNEIEITHREGNPIIYGLFEPIQKNN